jgi:gamma-glutamylcyclotransferase|nr:MAG: gamma-glutamylcyclotransferase [Bacteroidota bacterium]
MWVYFFAYGHNMNVANLKRAGIEPMEQQPAVLEDFRLVFNKPGPRPGEGYANIEPDPGSRVEGVLYSLQEQDLEKLDSLVGTPHAYERHTLPVRTAEGETVRAYVYRANPAVVRPNLKPSTAYLLDLLAARALLSPEYVRMLSEIETLETALRNPPA